MDQKKIMYWGFQLSGWGFIVFIDLLQQFQQFNYINIANLRAGVIVLILGISITHLLRLIILRLNWLKLKVVQCIPRILFCSIITSALLLFFTQMINLLLSGSVETEFL